MKKTMLLIVLALSSVSIFAQNDDDDKKFKFGVGGGLLIPLGDLKESFTYGVGIDAMAVYNFTENISAFAQAGFAVFKSSDLFTGDAGNVLHIPLLAGARFKFSGFFAGAGVGYGKWNSQGFGSGGMLISPHAGYDFGSLQVALSYNANKVEGVTYSYIGLKVFRTF